MLLTSRSLFAAVLLFPLFPSFAGARCPGNVASVHARYLAGALPVVPVEIDHTGPYDFMVDTGSQITLVDPELASSLHLEPSGNANLISVHSRKELPIVRLERLAVGEHALADLSVLLQSTDSLLAFDRRIRGVLGSDFLSHFDLLIDQRNGQLCLDASGALQRAIRGKRLPLSDSDNSRQGYASVPLVVQVHLRGAQPRGASLLIDSGATRPYLTRQTIPEASQRWVGRNVSNARSDVFHLSPLNVDIGEITLHDVRFSAPADDGLTPLQVDGLLPTALFSRVFISYADRFAVLEPWSPAEGGATWR